MCRFSTIGLVGLTLTWLLLVRVVRGADDADQGQPPAAARVVTLGFEEGQTGETPRDWFVPTEGWTAVLSDIDATNGKRAAQLYLQGQSTAPFGNLMRHVAADRYRGRRIRLSSRIRLEEPGGHAQMWLRVDRPERQMGFFDNMAQRPITATKWTDAVIEGAVDADATSLALGIMSQEGAMVFVDEVRLEDVGAAALQQASAARPLTQRGLDNVCAAVRLMAYIRYFHPSDEALAVNAWNHFAVHLVEQAELAEDDPDLASRLQAACAPIAPMLTVWAGDNAPPQPATPPEAVAYRYWRHEGAGRVASAGSIYSSKLRTIPISQNGGADGELDKLIRSAIEAVAGPEVGSPPPSPFLVKSLGRGVMCRLPVMVPIKGDRSLPESAAANPWASVDEQPRLTALNRSTRLAGVAALWGVMQHFYPYFDVVDTDWDAALDAALRDAAENSGELDYRLTVEQLVAKLHDGHGRAFNPRQAAALRLAVALAWAGRDLVVVGKHDSAAEQIAVGDVITMIDGQPVADRCAELSRRISAATAGWRQTRLLDLLTFADSGDERLIMRLRRPDGAEYDASVALIRPADVPDVTSQKPDDGAELEPGIVYFDLNGAETPALRAELGKLAAARGIVFDLRGYPGSAAYELMQHLIDKPSTSAQWNVPIVTLPDRERWEWTVSGWDLRPVEPHLSGEIAFLTDGRAISYAESIMGIVEHYKLGEIVGGATAGTNGNVNPFELPGGYTVMWTGMKVLKHDGSRHHGVGVKPTIAVEPTAAGIAAGRDEVLEKAVEALRGKIADER